ncbi:hypothetical protein R1flu_007150 [Riccia fluitans]|uniref:Uncharacterized protein n=1 Tax=Riccia fluitans TaxID=41844 RepID=A0ABD1YY10_9MARC
MNVQDERRVLNGGGTSSSSLVEEHTSSSQRMRQKENNGEGDGGLSSAADASYGLQVGSVRPAFSIIEHSGPLRPRPQKESAPHVRSKSVSWKDPMMYMQRLGSFRGPLFNLPRATQSFHLQPKAYSQPRKESSPERKKPSAWSRLLRKLGFDGGKKVHAARADWLNYDAKSYSMNFEKDRETQYASEIQQMPKISGPGAREIVTVLLQRSSSHNRNSGSVLLPRPVPHNMSKCKVAATPLWQRRAVTAPSSLDLSKFRPSSRIRGRRETSL